MGKSSRMGLPTKQKRITILLQVENTLDSYCRVCPYSGGNVQNKNCRSCPVNGQLQEYGRQLGWRENLEKFWTEEEDQYLKDNYGSRTTSQMMEDLQRSYAAIMKRIRRLREKGEL